MKIASGKSARAIRRQEICTRITQLLDQLAEKAAIISSANPQPEVQDFRKAVVADIVLEGRRLLFELCENAAIDANTPPRPRIRNK